MFSDFGSDSRAREAGRLALQQQQRAMLDAQVAERMASGAVPATVMRSGRRSLVNREAAGLSAPSVQRNDDGGMHFDRGFQPAALPTPASGTPQFSKTPAAAAEWTLPQINTRDMGGYVSAMHTPSVVAPPAEVSPLMGAPTPGRSGYGRHRSDITRGVSDMDVARRLAQQEKLAADLEEQVREKEARKAEERKRRWEEDQEDLRRLGIASAQQQEDARRIAGMAQQEENARRFTMMQEATPFESDAPRRGRRAADLSPLAVQPAIHGLPTPGLSSGAPKTYSPHVVEPEYVPGLSHPMSSREALASGDAVQITSALTTLEARLDKIVAAMSPSMNGVVAGYPSPRGDHGAAPSADSGALAELAGMVKQLMEEQRELRAALASQKRESELENARPALITPAQNVRKRGASSAPAVRRNAPRSNSRMRADAPLESAVMQHGAGRRASGHSSRNGYDRDGLDDFSDNLAAQQGKGRPPRPGAASAGVRSKSKPAFGRADEGKDTAAARRARGEARTREEAERRRMAAEASKISRQVQKEALRNQLAAELGAGEHESSPSSMPHYRSAAAVRGAGRLAVSPLSGRNVSLEPQMMQQQHRQPYAEAEFEHSLPSHDDRRGGGYGNGMYQEVASPAGFSPSERELGSSYHELHTESRLVPVSSSPIEDLHDARADAVALRRHQMSAHADAYERPSHIPMPRSNIRRGSALREPDAAPAALPGGKWGLSMHDDGGSPAHPQQAFRGRGAAAPPSPSKHGGIYSLINR